MKITNISKIRSKVLLTLSATFLLSGCMATKNENYATKAHNPEQFNQELIEQYNVAKRETYDSTYIQYKIDLESDDLVGMENKRLDIEINNMRYSDVLLELRNLTGKGISKENSREGESDVTFTYKANTFMRDLIISLERFANVDIVYKNNTFYVYNTITIQSTFNSFDDNQLKSLEELKNGLGTLLGKDSQIIIDKNTGTFVIKAKPNALRENMDFVENMINSRSRTALLKLYVYKINNSKLTQTAS